MPKCLLTIHRSSLLRYIQHGSDFQVIFYFRFSFSFGCSFRILFLCSAFGSKFLNPLHPSFEHHLKAQSETIQELTTENALQRWEYNTTHTSISSEQVCKDRQFQGPPVAAKGKDRQFQRILMHGYSNIDE
ncbi:hypothetical protein AT1G80865 [Arabidopsis thaliana]|uniref:Uncharacterized protein At1g80865 n=1 Tax=Arabidopsis thaliana TaxID=3702 RepID=Q8VZS2_ARATH|nr:uncharacterized protein AT1G80865 [Arabidopsis thaliana]AAL36243.1 unknown protein [Arabidopsis thaliana]AAM20095.1 unknown protein [Arabidopsis thaliana]AEE36461.1 hypothetical protein AT1G80865 [Arabidopsis thaliana]|eukprot:NP_683512.1 hypothetical protein AT1G80865 [Arabidopsis thaliana]